MQERTTVRGCVNGVWKPCGTLYPGDPPVFVQHIKPEHVLRIRGAAGIDLQYDPPLPKNTIIRHRVDGQETVEIELADLLDRPKASRALVGSRHPERVYLAYRYWRRAGSREPQLQLLVGWIERPGGVPRNAV